nr:uncharacterized protein LOC132424617 isoform X1 [Delphinus delphis]
MGRKGKKGLRNLAEELNGVERRGEGLGRGGLSGGGRSAAAGGRRARRSKSASQTLQQSPELGRRRRRRRRRRRWPRRRDDPAPRPHARPWPRVSRCARQCRSEARARWGAEGGRGGGAPSRSEPAGAPGSEPRRPRSVWIVSNLSSILRIHYFNIWEKHIQKNTDICINCGTKGEEGEAVYSLRILSACCCRPVC